MPVTKSAKKALRTAERRHEENLIQRDTYKKAIKSVRKAVASGVGSINELFSAAQSTLDRAAKNNTIHKNKAARLKSRLAKAAAVVSSTEVAPVVKKSTPKKTAAGKKTVAGKKAAAKKTAAKK